MPAALPSCPLHQGKRHMFRWNLLKLIFSRQVFSINRKWDINYKSVLMKKVSLMHCRQSLIKEMHKHVALNCSFSVMQE